jgi:vacuolar-type H+-ATPase subunit D/Vma8
VKLQATKADVEALIVEQTQRLTDLEQTVLDNIKMKRESHIEELRQLETEYDEMRADLGERWRHLQEQEEALDANQTMDDTEERRREAETELMKVTRCYSVNNLLVILNYFLDVCKYTLIS